MIRAIVILLALSSTVRSELLNDIYEDLRYEITSLLRELETQLTPTNVTFEDVTFLLYTPEYNGTILTKNNLNYLNLSTTTYFIIHGWTDAANNSWILNLTAALLDRETANVITVDWSYLASLFYLTAAVDARGVGRVIGEFIVYLEDIYNANLTNIQLIGHSLGAQVCGFAGQTIKNLTDSQVYKIIGLDPAGPDFEIAAANDEKLSEDDAYLVIGLHTDAGALGILGSVGAIDFFPNGGTPVQPGCENIKNACSHMRATEILIEAVKNSSAFLATECENYLVYQLGGCNGNRQINIGGDITLADAGDYYLETKAEAPLSF